MPITEDERQLFYEVIDIPNDTSILSIDGQFGTGRKQVDYAITSAKTEVDARLDALSGAKLERLQALLARWDLISIKDESIEPNGSNEGARKSFARERSLIKQRILTIVPVFVAGNSTSDGSIPLG